MPGLLPGRRSPSKRFMPVPVKGPEPVTEPKYLGEITYTASADASGTFVISLIDPGMDEGTHVRDSSLALIDLVTEPVVIQVQTAGGIPTTSTWGLIVFALAVIAVATVLIRTKPRNVVGTGH